MKRTWLSIITLSNVKKLRHIMRKIYKYTCDLRKLSSSCVTEIPNGSKIWFATFSFDLRHNLFPFAYRVCVCVYAFNVHERVHLLRVRRSRKPLMMMSRLLTLIVSESWWWIMLKKKILMFDVERDCRIMPRRTKKKKRKNISLFLNAMHVANVI